MRDQAIQSSERWHQADVSISLSAPRKPADHRVPVYVATVRWEYTVAPKHAVRRFTVVSDRAEYRELAADPEATSTWFIREEHGIDAADRSSWELVQFSVDGDPRTIRRSERKGGQTYTVSVGPEIVNAPQPVTIAYTYRALVPRQGHLLHLDMEAPTRNVAIQLDYSDTDIAYVNVLDFFVSSHQTRVEHMPPNVPEKSVLVAHDGWVFQRSGVAFVWVNAHPRSPRRS